MSRFPDDHPIQWVASKRRPTRTGIVRELAKRAAWLAKKIDRHRALTGEFQQADNPLVRELLAVVRAAELLQESNDD